MLALDWPWMLMALPLPLLARWLPPAPPAGGSALRLPFAAPAAGEAARPGSRRQSTRRILAWLAWGLLVLAAARPQWLGEPLELPVTGRDLLLALDLSGSMEQQDFEWHGRPASRLDVVRELAAAFVAHRDQDRLGLILFGSQAYLQTPLTFDRATVSAMIRETVAGLAGRETAIGDAIALGVRQLREQPADNRVLILLTDGANTAGVFDPRDAARLAAESGVRIHTIGIGGGPLGGPTLLGIRLTRPGEDFDPDTLRQVAALTGGQFFVAHDRDQLAAVYAELNRLEPSIRDARTWRPQRALHVWPAAGALLLTAGLALSALSRRADPA